MAPSGVHLNKECAILHAGTNFQRKSSQGCWYPF